jgi:hypothetical protein
MTRPSSCTDQRRSGTATALWVALTASALPALLPTAGCDDGAAPTPRPPSRVAARDPRPFTPWHPVDAPLPFPDQEWFWQDLFAAAPAPEPLPADPEAAAAIAATLERVAVSELLASEALLPPLVGLARRDLAALLAGLDDPRREVRFAVSRVMVRLMSAADDPTVCPFPQRLVEAAARHLRDTVDEIALLHLETIAAGRFAWMEPVLLKTFGKVDNHRLTVLRVRAAAKLAEQGNLGGMPLLIRILKEETPLQDDIAREWDASPRTAWWKEEAIQGIAALAGHDFGHSPDASAAEQVAAIRRIEAWWEQNRFALHARRRKLADPELIARVERLILAFGTFQLRNVDNAAFLLKGLGPAAAPWLFQALEGSSYRIRVHVLEVLGRQSEDVSPAERENWIARIAPALSDPDEAVQVAALRAIGATAIPAALPHLKAALDPEKPALCETALRELSRQERRTAREVLTPLAKRLPPEHLLATPCAVARLAAGDLDPLPEFLQRLASDDARSARYLSWIVAVDAWSDAKGPLERQRALERIEAEIRARADS